MKINQKGAVGMMLTATFLIVVAVGGFMLWRSRGSDNLASNNQSSNGRVKIYGESVFIRQNEVDVPVGEEPYASTVLVGSEKDLRDVLKPVLSADGFIVTYRATEEAMRAGGVRAVQTAEGSFDFGISRSEKAICLVQKSTAQLDGVASEVRYSLEHGGACKLIKTDDKEVNINMSSMGFGASGLSCIPAKDCADMDFTY